MELRIDRLLARLQNEPETILQAIDRDPLLTKRESGELVLANASKSLFTPQKEHHLYAKGIVYRRDPYRLVSLPLLKIYNLGEHEVTLDSLLELTQFSREHGNSRIHFLRKYDGTLIQRFQNSNRVWFTTRGMIEGALLGPKESQDEENEGNLSHFDYLGQAKSIAFRKYPILLEGEKCFENLTMLFEFIHPQARIITDYGSMEELILLTIFDQKAHRYWSYREVDDFAREHRLQAVDPYQPSGTTLKEQIDSLLSMVSGTDQEGAVIVFEHGDDVVYRVKVKSPDYLRLLRLMVRCTYSSTVETLDTMPKFPTWEEFKDYLQAQGTEAVPEEVLAMYREYYQSFAQYLTDCEQVRDVAIRQCQKIRSRFIGIDSSDPRAIRKAFADQVKTLPHRSLLFSALDERLDVKRVREFAPTPEELKETWDRMQKES